MSLKPLDLQTLFSHLNEVSKNQSHLRDAAAAQQNFEAKKLVEQEQINDTSVNATLEDQETGKVDDQKKEQEQNQKRGKRSPGEEEEVPEKEEIRDPDLGQNIDLMG